MLAGSAAAQSGMGMAFSRDILVGPFVTGGVAMNAGTLLDGWTASPGFSFSAGGYGIVPVSEDMAITLGLAYDSRAFTEKLDSIKLEVSRSVRYLAIRPGFKFKSFQLAFGIGLPMGGSESTNDAGISPNSTFDVNSSDMAVLTEIRAGFGFPLMKSDNNELRLLVEGSYGFSKIAKNSDANTKNDGPLATAQVGVAYLFDVSHSSSY